MSFVLILLIGATVGVAFAVVDALVVPVVRGWRADRQAHSQARRMRGHDNDPLGPIDSAPSYTATFAGRLIDNLVVLGLIGGVLFAVHLAGFV